MPRVTATSPALTQPGSGVLTADLYLTPSGALRVSQQGDQITYKAATAGVVETANGVMFSLQGSATKTVRVTRVFVGGVLTTAAQVLVQIYRTTGAVSSAAGTVAITPVKLASASAVATAVANSYTSSTLGAGSGLIGSQRVLYAPATASSSYADFTFGTRNVQPIILSGTAEFLQVSVTASSYTGALFDIDVEFTEE